MKKINTQHHTEQMKKYWIRSMLYSIQTNMCIFIEAFAGCFFFYPPRLCYRVALCVCYINVCAFWFVFFEQQWKEAGNFRKEKEVHNPSHACARANTKLTWQKREEKSATTIPIRKRPTTLNGTALTVSILPSPYENSRNKWQS